MTSPEDLNRSNKMRTPDAILSDDLVDLRVVFRALWVSRYMIFAAALGGICFAAIYAYLIAKPVFKSTALLIPTISSSSGQMGAALSLLGQKSSTNPDVELYQSLLTSRTVTTKLLGSVVRNESDTAMGREEPLFSVLGVDTANRFAVEASLASLAKSVAVSPRSAGTEGIIEISFTANTPWLAQQIGNRVLEIGQEELRIVQVKRAQAILARLSVAVEKTRAERDQAAGALASYKTRNRSILDPGQMEALMKLEMEKTAKEQKFLLARNEYELQELSMYKAAPSMVELDAANLPLVKFRPRRRMIIGFGLVMGIMLGCFGVVGKALMRQARNAPH